MGGLAVRGYLGEQRSPGEITGIGQADLPGRCGRKVGRRSSAMGSENEVRSYWRANVRASVGGRGPDRRNTIRVYCAAGGVRGLRSVIQYINAVLSGERSPAKQ